MEVEAFSQKISNVLSKGKFIIPDYQREFDWDDTEIDELLEDVEGIEPNESYFIGHMVFEGKFTGNEFKVIDGQQRITTITILLSVIRDLFYTMGLQHLGNGIHNNYIFRKDVSDNEYVVLENKMPYPVLQSYVQSVPEKKDLRILAVKSGEKKIISAYDYFNKIFRTKNENELTILRDKILNLEVIFVAASEKVDAHSIFMTLNATGKDLTPIDLIKNQIFSKYPKQVHIDEPNDTWKKIIENVEDKGIKFFNNFWSSRYKKISDGRIFKEFIKNIVRKNADYEAFLKNLHNDSIIFRKINNPSEDDWNKDTEYACYLSLQAITEIFKIEVANSMLMSLLREYTEKEISLVYLMRALNSIEKFHFINNAICSNRSSGLDHLYSKLSRDLILAKDRHHKHMVIDEMITKLNQKIPSKENFIVNIDAKLYYSQSSTKQKKLVQYSLRKIEFKKQNGNILMINMSLEHIYPENPKANVWPKINNAKIKNIGNLVLLDSGLNSSIGNVDYLTKKSRVINESQLISTKEVFNDNTEWNEKSIDHRRDLLINALYIDVWN